MTRMETHLIQENTLTFNENSLHFVVENGKLWCVFADACRALEIVDVEKAASYLTDTEKKVLPSSTPKQKPTNSIFPPLFPLSQETTNCLCVDLSGLYFLAVNADTMRATPFRIWLTDVALPEIWNESHAAPPVSSEDCLHAVELLRNCGNCEERVLDAILAILYQGGFHVEEV